MSEKKREPLLIVATGQKGVGKTYTTCQVIEKYIKDNQQTGKKARKVLIFDTNEEYSEGSFRDNNVSFIAPVLAIDDLAKWTKQNRVEVRRIIPRELSGRVIDDKASLLERILKTFRGGLLILEDINSYLIDTRTSDIISVMTTNRHKDLDIYIHMQSLAPVTTRMWQNLTVCRFHKQMDTIDRYKKRIPHMELYQVAEKLVEQQYLRDVRFYAYVNNEYQKINGKFSIKDFQKACYTYLVQNPIEISKVQKQFGAGIEAREKAIKIRIADLMKYYGNPIRN